MTTIIMLALASAFVLTVLAYLMVDTGGTQPPPPSASTSVARRVQGSSTRWR